MLSFHVRTGSLLDRLIMELPLCIGSYEHARVGEDIQTVRRFTPKFQKIWGRRSNNAVIDEDPVWCYHCNTLIRLGEQSVDTYYEMGDPEVGPQPDDLIEVIVHKRCYKDFLKNGPLDDAC